jgi:DNA-binding FadR family transcriptional regulator
MVATAPPAGRVIDKLSMSAARDIVLAMARDQLGPGQPLESEAQLAARHGVGRASLREALRVLQVLGLIRIRTGPGGGPSVTEVNGQTFARLTSFYLHMAGATYGDLVNARLIMEPVMAGLAARRRGREGRRRLGGMARIIHEVSVVPDEAYHRVSSEFHDAVLGLSGNAVLDLFARSLKDLFSRRILDVAYPPEQREVARASHATIAAAVLIGDASAAETLMRRHMLMFVEHVRRTQPSLLDEVVQWNVAGASMGPHSRGTGVAAVGNPKISETVAARIVDEIEASGLGAGDRLRSEAKMALELGIGRNSVREALRILEIYGLVSLRRGTGGGPVVEQLDAVDFARVSSLYFQRLSATIAQLMEARVILEPVVARVAGEAPARVRMRVDAPEPPPGGRQPGKDQFLERGHSFHGRVAEAVHNPVLRLYAGALRELYTDRVREDHIGGINRGRVDREHAAIAAAISQGRADDAELLMRAHLNYTWGATRKADRGLFSEVVDWGRYDTSRPD